MSESPDGGNGSVAVLSDRGRIEDFLRADAGLHLYELGDLDDFFWPRTTWCGWQSDGNSQSVSAQLGLSFCNARNNPATRA